MKEFVNIVKKEIKKGKCKAVIIDLRYNTGGNSRIFEPMISELKQLKKNFGFDVYTIIGENTFS
ncbi:MAG: hypothetical protein GX077_01880 [Tissierellia bacterium]|nr:hypothetical protein [Tissierellia bacterium]